MKVKHMNNIYNNPFETEQQRRQRLERERWQNGSQQPQPLGSKNNTTAPTWQNNMQPTTTTPTQPDYSKMSLREELSDRMDRAGFRQKEWTLSTPLGNFTYLDDSDDDTPNANPNRLPEQFTGSATVSQSEPLAFAKQTFTNQTEEKNPFNNWLDAAQETGRELLDQGQNHLNTQWNTAKHKGVNLLKQGFDYIDQNQLGATNNSADDFRIIGQEGINNLRNITYDSFNKNSVKETYEDSIDSLARNTLGAEKYNNFIGKMTGAAYAVKNLINNPQNITNLHDIKQNYNYAYNIGKKQNEVDYQNALQRSPVATRIVGYGTKGYFGGKQIAKSIYNKLSPSFNRNVHSKMDFTKDNLNQITDYELKKQKEKEEKEKNKFYY